MTERVSAPAHSFKSRIMDTLWEYRTQTRRPPYTVDKLIDAPAIASLTGLPLHDVMHVLHSLQKQDAIRFRERKRATKAGGMVGSPAGPRPKATPARLASMPGGGHNLDSFQITAAGEALRYGKLADPGSRDAAAGRDDAAIARLAGMPAGVVITKAELEAHAMAVDIAPGHKPYGKRVNGAPPMTVAEAVQDMAPEPTFVDHVLGRAPQTAATDTEPAGTPVTRPELPKPLAAVLRRHEARQKVQAASDALEAAGYTDQAIAILDQVPWSELDQAIAEHLIAEGYGQEA